MEYRCLSKYSEVSPANEGQFLFEQARRSMIIGALDVSLVVQSICLDIANKRRGVNGYVSVVFGF